ncbi:hypothetical protein QR680_002223 [Steinernema hermaphroditum]|uniref:Uncharacterized protein n=1 Tax=Steinernema hermaphroditum TaxID=289476 RepID=A0AA39H2Q1_9BILA|nr:hypothetical protein QR680_002223 [Steinernema hermaphroditum]
MDEEYLYGTNSDDNAEEEYRSDNGHHSKNIPWINAPSEVFSNCSSSNNLKEDIPCQKDVLRFYKDLQTYGVPEMLYQFENVIGSLCKEIKEQKDQNETLQQVYHQEREMHNRRMNEVEHELDQQLSYAEEKARAEERQRLNKEKEDMRIRLEEEVDHLKSSIEKLQKDLSVENRSLKSNLADNHLEITLIKAELAQVRSEYESKQADFFNEKENVFAAIQQKENLERQLELLYDANKKLHEANDTLTVALDHRSSVCQQFNIRAASPSNFSLSRQSSLLSFNDARLSANRRSNGCISSEDGHIQTAQDAPAEYEISLKSCSSDEFEQPEYIGGDGGNEEGLSEPTGPPERTFRVVLCGDASVGKSSIIMRIVKGVYASGLPSTLEEFLRNEFDYASYLNQDVIPSTVPFRDVNTDTFWKLESVHQNELRRYIEKNITKELAGLETKPWLPTDQIIDELAQCIHYDYGTINKQHFMYDKNLYGWMHMMKFSCILVDDRYVFGIFLARFRFRLKEVLLRKQYRSWASNSRSITIRDTQKMIEHFWGMFASESDKCARKELKKMGFHEDSEAMDTRVFNIENNIDQELGYSIATEAKRVINNMYPASDIVELSQNTRRDHFFKNVSIPVTIRLVRLRNREIPAVLDIVWKDLSTASQNSLEMCSTQFCEESDQVSELTEFNGSKPSRFFKDRALRYNLSPDSSLITYASSRPTFFGDSGQQSKSTKFRKLKKLIASETETEWYKLLDWQVAHNFRANIPDAFRHFTF